MLEKAWWQECVVEAVHIMLDQQVKRGLLMLEQRSPPHFYSVWVPPGLGVTHIPSGIPAFNEWKLSCRHTHHHRIPVFSKLGPIFIWITLFYILIVTASDREKPYYLL